MLQVWRTCLGPAQIETKSFNRRPGTTGRRALTHSTLPLSLLEYDWSGTIRDHLPDFTQAPCNTDPASPGGQVVVAGVLGKFHLGAKRGRYLKHT